MPYFKLIQKLISAEDLDLNGYHDEGSIIDGRYFLTELDDLAWIRLNYETNGVDILVAGSSKFVPVPNDTTDVIDMIKNVKGKLIELPRVRDVQGNLTWSIPFHLD